VNEPLGDLRTRNTRPVAARVSTAGSALPCGTDSERDHQVRVRLAELAPAAAVPVEELLEQPAGARSFGLLVPTDLDPAPRGSDTRPPGRRPWCANALGARSGAWTPASTAALPPGHGPCGGEKQNSAQRTERCS